MESASRTPGPSVAVYEVSLRIFSRACGRAQRENIATDVHLFDSEWRQFDPIPNGREIPLNALLQPGESLLTTRKFELPLTAHDVVLRIDRRAGPAGPPICWIIGQCEAFHKGTVVRIY